ncbi:hypothetical protein Nepgr_030528 [Nepenthes gracilis]|uniref:Late embryogenesis abundant protein LEA-2 subgroup domain-containing protein n=1 Tax=Nepenthes gracilis TaxID=150966 RepID=A0AAD3TES3_NEPGR|nr:hypothetical protein Nepgr_030528 [Nepenthes gracilis]
MTQKQKVVDGGVGDVGGGGVGDVGGGGGEGGSGIQSKRRCSWCLVAVSAVFLLLLTLFLLLLILALTVYRPKQPRTEIVSATVDGVTPRVSFPAISVELNVSLNFTVLVKNRNHASFKHDSGETLLLYRGRQVGAGKLDPGTIPAMGSTTMGCRLTLASEKLELDPNLTSLAGDVVGGQLTLEAETRIPGKMTFMRIFNKHLVAISDCRIVVGIPNFTVGSQECKYRTKF